MNEATVVRGIENLERLLRAVDNEFGHSRGWRELIAKAKTELAWMKWLITKETEK
jgi:hypothetical protein